MFKYCSFRNLVSGLVLAFATAAASAGVVLNIDSSTQQLRGASGISVNGGIYSVEFVDGTCASVFGACTPGNFVASNLVEANAFSTALSHLPFITETGFIHTFGCDSPYFCGVITPYDTELGYVLTSVAFAATGAEGSDRGVDVSSKSFPIASSTGATGPSRVWARWSQQSTNSVPEPASLTLLVVAGAAMIGAQRRRREGKVVQ